MSPGLLLINGRIYTMDPALPRAQAVALSGRRIMAVGAEKDLLGVASGDEWRIVDLQGRAVLPAFTDSHLHLLDCALKASMSWLPQSGLWRPPVAPPGGACSIGWRPSTRWSLPRRMGMSSG